MEKRIEVIGGQVREEGLEFRRRQGESTVAFPKLVDDESDDTQGILPRRASEVCDGYRFGPRRQLERLQCVLQQRPQRPPVFRLATRVLGIAGFALASLHAEKPLQLSRGGGILLRRRRFGPRMRRHGQSAGRRIESFHGHCCCSQAQRSEVITGW
eukprot:TRINITY_DN40119_c0_g1_i1.p2 TRINITY_DN40119_c0_g1~~TRINITY_DN40119_c0_g1_i1.p2  ORF type:complete len:156 (-),score=1.13 TRINITY_DN40119_c0_g1_i1:239-706(-)